MTPIDLRSDTVTTPTHEMRQAMMTAPIGDDVYGEDPTVNRLEAKAAELTHMEAALFAPTGTQTNLLALLAHCQRGDEYIVGSDAHTYMYEGGGAAVLGSIQPCTIPFNEKAELPIIKIQSAIKPNDPHFARTRLVALENTQHGRVLNTPYLKEVSQLCQQQELGLHLDGARVFHATTKLNIQISEITQHLDSISICLSKGLCAPVGSLLCGNKDLIAKARRYRKMLGGGMRQAGILAAAGLIALEKMPERLQEDHDKAQALSALLKSIEGLTLRENWNQTNMVWADFDNPIGSLLTQHCAANGIKISPDDSSMRLVLHKDISHDQINRIGQVFSQFFEQT